jgi:hypothetical protein
MRQSTRPAKNRATLTAARYSYAIMQLPVFNIITRSVRDIWQNRRDFAAFAFLPILVVSIIGTLMSAVIGDVRIIIDDPTQVPPQVVLRMFFGTFVNWLAGFALYTVFAVAWHRRTLAGPEATVGAALRWGRRQWRFFRRLVFLIVNLMVLMFLLAVLLMAVIPVAPVLSARPLSALLDVGLSRPLRISGGSRIPPSSRPRCHPVGLSTVFKSSSAGLGRLGMIVGSSRLGTTGIGASPDGVSASRIECA